MSWFQWHWIDYLLLWVVLALIGLAFFKGAGRG